MFESFRNQVKNVEIEEEINDIPVEKADIENMIKLINTAHEVGCVFALKLTLTIGELCVDSDSYTGIKLLPKNKNENERLSVSYKNALLSNNTFVDLDNILHIQLEIIFDKVGVKY